MSVIRLFAGHDPREAVGFHVFTASVVARASAFVAITALDSRGLPQGSNAFTYSRFLVPYLCEFSGHAIFMDGADMLCQADIAELDALFDPRFAVQVVQHAPYKTRHPIKYIGTEMQCPNLDYARKNWASVMLFNCAHPAWAVLTPEYLERASVQLLRFDRVADDLIGALPNEWNRLVDEGHPVEGAKLLHWTAGVPAFKHYAAAPGAALWHAERAAMLEVV